MGSRGSGNNWVVGRIVECVRNFGRRGLSNVVKRDQKIAECAEGKGLIVVLTSFNS